MQTVICIRWGTRYGADYVNRLYRGVMRHVSRPTRFVAFTDDPAGLDPGVDAIKIPVVSFDSGPDLSRAGLKPGPWRKLALWSTDLGGLDGEVLFLDLDVLVTGPLDPFFDYEPGRLCVIRNWTQGRREGIGNTSVLRFRAGSAPHLLRDFEADPVAMSYRHDNEQIYVTRAAGLPMAFWPSGWCASFKHDLMPPWPFYIFIPPALSAEARVVVFTGHPRPDEALAGRWPAKWYKRFYKALPPVPWISDHWY